MKKLISALLICSLFTACENKEAKKLQEENHRLQTEASYKDSTINGLIQSFNEVEDNLANITQKEGTIRQTTKGNAEFKEDAKARINQEIQAISELMEKNKQAINELKSKLKSSNIKAKEFQRMIERLNAQIAMKDSTINNLKEQLVAMNFKIEKLNSHIDTLNQEGKEHRSKIDQQTAALNTAYYLIGNFKELKKRGILSKEGSVIGIGGSAKLQNLSADNFNKIDITKMSSFTLPGKKARLVTSHPAGTYKWVGEEKKRTSFEVTDPTEFWKASKYLVILVD